MVKFTVALEYIAVATFWTCLPMTEGFLNTNFRTRSFSHPHCGSIKATISNEWTGFKRNAKKNSGKFNGKSQGISNGGYMDSLSRSNNDAENKVLKNIDFLSPEAEAPAPAEHLKILNSVNEVPNNHMTNLNGHMNELSVANMTELQGFMDKVTESEIFAKNNQVSDPSKKTIEVSNRDIVDFFAEVEQDPSLENTYKSPSIKSLDKTSSTELIEEKIVADLSFLLDDEFDNHHRDLYLTSARSLEESIKKTDTRLSKTAYHEVHIKKKIYDLEQTFLREKARLENELEGKLVASQRFLDQETNIILELMQTVIDREEKRKEKVSHLLESIEYATQVKQNEIESNEAITAEMKKMRSKVNPESHKMLTSQLDDLQARSLQEALLNVIVLQDLITLQAHTLLILECTDTRLNQMKHIHELYSSEHPNAKKIASLSSEEDGEYQRQLYQKSFSSTIGEMEHLLEDASKKAREHEDEFKEIYDRIAQSLHEKSDLLGLPVQDMQEMSVAKTKEVPAIKVELDSQKSSEKIKELVSSPSNEVLGVFGKEAANVAISATKTAVFGVKSLEDPTSSPKASAAAQETGQSLLTALGAAATLAVKFGSNALKFSGSAFETMKQIQDKFAQAQAQKKANAEMAAKLSAKANNIINSDPQPESLGVKIEPSINSSWQD